MIRSPYLQLCTVQLVYVITIKATPLMLFNNAPTIVKAGGGGPLGICGAFNFSEEYLVKIPNVKGRKNG